MSGPRPSRRAVTVGGGIAAALGLTALGLTVPKLFGHRYPKTPYDDLFAHLIDRGEAVKVGKAALEPYMAMAGRFAPPQLDPKWVARTLRGRLDRRSLADVTNSDLAEGRLTEVKGWVLPETLVLLCVLAAEAG